jgi:hypothetical protein
MPQIHNLGFPHEFQRLRSHNRPTNPINKPQLIATRKCNSRSKGLRQSAVSGADGPRGLGGRSARPRSRTVLHHEIQMVRTLPLYRADSPRYPGRWSANTLQQNGTSLTDRTTNVQEQLMNWMNNGPHRLSAPTRRTVPKVRIEQLKRENEKSTPPIHHPGGCVGVLHRQPTTGSTRSR